MKEKLSILANFKCPTVIRITPVQDLNMRNLIDYADLIEKGNQPTSKQKLTCMSDSPEDDCGIKICRVVT